MPRIKIAPRKTGISNDPDFKQSVIIAPQNAFITTKGAADLVHLRHPRSGKGILYLFSPDNKAIFEVLRMKEEKTSWFVNDTVIEDGQFTYFSPYDPVFHVLPYLMKCAREKKVMPLADALVDEDFPETSRILQCKGLDHLSSVAVKKGSPDFNAWAYSEEKTLKWLEQKVKQIEDGWKDLDISNSRLCSASENPEQVKFEAFDALAEYLPLELVQKLRQTLKLPDDLNKTDCETTSSTLKRRTSDVSNGALHKTSQCERDTPKGEEFNKPKIQNPNKKRKITPAAPRSNSANNISKYFTKK